MSWLENPFPELFPNPLYAVPSRSQGLELLLLLRLPRWGVGRWITIWIDGDRVRSRQPSRSSFEVAMAETTLGEMAGVVFELKIATDIYPVSFGHVLCCCCR